MLQDVIKKYETVKKNREKNLSTLREKIEQEIETETIKCLKRQNHVSS